MRTIKFRGKRVDNNEWVYGDLLQPTEFCNIYEISDCNSFDGTRYDVIPETIGQFTGLYDKNGKEICEKDIVKIINKNNKVVSIKPVIAAIEWSTEYLSYILITTSINDVFENLGDYLDYDIEIIGNTIDNKNLLEGE